MDKLIKNTSLYTLGYIIPKAAQFILLPVYSRYLTPEEYGIVQLMMVLSTILAILFSTGIDRSIYRLYFDQKTEKNKKDYLGTVTITIFISASLFLIIILVANPLISKIFNLVPFFPYYLYSILTVYFTVFGLVPNIYYQVTQQAGNFILISLLNFIISTSLVLYFVAFIGKGAEGWLLGELVKSILFLPIYIYLIIKITNFTFIKKLAVESISYSWPLVPTLLSAWILNLSDRIFIVHYVTLKDAGLYSISYKLAEGLLLLSAGFNQAYSPLFFKLANQDNQIEAKKKLFRYNKIYTTALIMGAFFISLFAKEFIFLLDASYKSAYELVPLINMGILFSLLSNLIGLQYKQSKRTKISMSIALFTAIINIGLNFVFVPNYGAYGAAIATTISFVFIFIVNYHFSKKCYFIPFAWKDILPLFLILFIISALFSNIVLSFKLTVFLKIFILSILLVYMVTKHKNVILILINKGM